MTIWVSSRLVAPQLARQHNVVKAVSLLAPGDTFPTIDHLDDTSHLKLAMDDVDLPEANLQPPQKEHVQQLISFMEDWTRDDPVLIHCWAGISRSSASAFITACLHNPDADEFEIAKNLRKASRTAKPNRRLIQFADELMSRDGRMIDAVASMGPHDFSVEAKPFSISSVFNKARGHWV